jgi:hypothetical protein
LTTASTTSAVVDLTGSSPPSPCRYITGVTKFSTDEEYARSLLLSFEKEEREQIQMDETIAKQLSKENGAHQQNTFDPTKAMIGARVLRK